LEYVHVVPAAHVPEPVQVWPAHCPHFAIVPPVGAAEVVLVLLVLVVFVVLIVLIVLVSSVVFVKLVLVGFEDELDVIAEPPRRLTTAVYAGFFVKSAFQRQASPCPEKTDGIHEYLSVKSQIVTPTQPVVWIHDPTMLT
jgi:hypothetical protein